ncbi:hypothetical protein HPO96_18400 [Kribbella sandramycini]|uniref:Uncharacterized protein n=1 Tax=Kribbella sandramycini TaxID=60450 RepID=A0A7Y4L0R6_9ACTN|nr:hypothetical protein [Kribbella sandramycini]MBB6564516.1 hypothetical protein [Kribbella sandramycini]NOL42220.1 hypothetical protein [Kribbella sandramycini]
MLSGLDETFRDGYLDGVRREEGVEDHTGATLVGRTVNATVGVPVRGLAAVLTRLTLRSGQSPSYRLGSSTGGCVSAGSAMCGRTRRIRRRTCGRGCCARDRPPRLVSRWARIGRVLSTGSSQHLLPTYCVR